MFLPFPCVQVWDDPHELKGSRRRLSLEKAISLILAWSDELSSMKFCKKHLGTPSSAAVEFTYITASYCYILPSNITLVRVPVNKYLPFPIRRAQRSAQSTSTRNH
ncbi:hypothetical protein M513_10799 [Trichuris suis]|uniref:Uncharacterized protein n=1 Tax=Trichuris suis TaxID=68888 RepID=A0A085LTL1_9BILA|nr:hypothetical protein M513_10799 [Trichuris suis]